MPRKFSLACEGYLWQVQVCYAPKSRRTERWKRYASKLSDRCWKLKICLVALGYSPTNHSWGRCYETLCIFLRYFITEVPLFVLKELQPRCPIFCFKSLHTIWLNNRLKERFLLVSCSNTAKNILWSVYGQGQERKAYNKDFLEISYIKMQRKNSKGI